MPVHLKPFSLALSLITYISLYFRSKISSWAAPKPLLLSDLQPKALGQLGAGCSSLEFCWWAVWWEGKKWCLRRRLSDTVGAMSAPEGMREQRNQLSGGSSWWGSAAWATCNKREKTLHPNEVIQSWSEFLLQLLMAVPAGCTGS